LSKDSLLAAVLLALAFVPQFAAVAAMIGDLPRRPLDALGVILILAQCLPLAIRTRWPAACLAVVGCGFALHQVLAYPATFGSIGLYVALYSAGAHQQRLRTVVAVVAVVGYGVLALTLNALGSPTRGLDFVLFFAALAVIWFAGAGVRRWRREEAERRRLSAEMATAAERARIARELHDVVTHHVTAMVVQADAAQLVLDTAPDRAGESLSAISVTGRRALTELRSLLGVLEASGETPPAERTPSLGKVADLVEQARHAGQPVEFLEEGEQRPRTVDVELTAYRVVQESLTNALKYAAGRPTTVRLRHDPEEIEIEVITKGPATSPGGSSGGRGLTGLSERVRLLGGELQAGPRADGGFGVRALIPCGRNEP
jgi:signal transduction histidine kinase